MVKLYVDLAEVDGEVTGWLYAPPPENLLSIEKGIHSSDVLVRLTLLGLAWLKGTGQRGQVVLRRDIAARSA